MENKFEKLLLAILEKQEDGLIIALNGEWGVGKTYFWNDFIKKYYLNQKKFKKNSCPSCIFLEKTFLTLEKVFWYLDKLLNCNFSITKKLFKQNNKQIAYVSLFGKETLKEIETDIILQVSKGYRVKEKLKNILGSSNIIGIDIASCMSLIPKSDFKNIVICFDDFERKSNKLDTKDILGLISQFKEQKNCKVIMIFNKDKIHRDDKDIFCTFKDKIIDYELQYKPTIEQSYNIAVSNLKCFKEYPLEYFKKK